MIPRTRQPAPIPESNVPQDLPPIEHTAIDYEWLCSNGSTISVSIVDNDGTIVAEESDRWTILMDDGRDRTNIFKPVISLRVIHRTFETDPPLYDPRQIDR